MRKNDDLCNGARKRFRILIDLISDFKKTYENKTNTITFMHYVENSHNTNDRFNWIDNDLFHFLQNGHKNNLFNNTAIFLFSDHGMRFTDKRASNNRYLEERMPFFSIYLPDRYKIQNSFKFNNLKENTNYLTSPFDIYATVRDLTGLEPLNDSKAKSPELQRSISLLNKISPKRNCEHIGISDHFCICVQDWIVQSVTEKSVIKAAKYSVQVINEITSSMRKKCSELILKEIISAELLIKGEYTMYKIQFITLPNKGVYETLLFKDYYNISEFKSIEFSIKSRNDISRIDSYGEQPRCVADFQNNPEFVLDLRKFCCCHKSSIKNNIKNKIF